MIQFGISVASQPAKFLPRRQAVTNKVEGGKRREKYFKITDEIIIRSQEDKIISSTGHIP